MNPFLSEQLNLHLDKETESIYLEKNMMKKIAYGRFITSPLAKAIPCF